MDPFATQKRHDGTELEVTGISRSGRVRKKSSKLVDFESPGSVSDSKSKKPKIQTTPESQKKKMVVEHQTPKKIIATKKFPKQLPIKKPEIEPSSDYETQSTNSESDEENITINNNQSIKNIEVTNLKITNSANKLSNPQENKKKVVFAKGTIKINKNKVEENKTKPKSRYTAYMLWSKEMRQKLLKENSGMDFTTVSKKLGELWSAVPTNEKYNWNNRAKRLTEKNQTISPTLPKTLVIKTNEPKKTIEISTLMNSSVSNQAGKDANKSPTKDLQIFRTIELEPIDVAAYLKLLGESLTCIGERLKEHNGQITVSGSLSVLLDSLLCALGSLTCLTQQVPEIRSQNSAALSKTLENIAYIMPGL